MLLLNGYVYTVLLVMLSQQAHNVEKTSYNVIAAVLLIRRGNRNNLGIILHISP